MPKHRHTPPERKTESENTKCFGRLSFRVRLRKPQISIPGKRKIINNEKALPDQLPVRGEVKTPVSGTAAGDG
jgi:hypothetical protein